MLMLIFRIIIEVVTLVAYALIPIGIITLFDVDEITDFIDEAKTITVAALGFVVIGIYGAGAYVAGDNMTEIVKILISLTNH